MATQTVKTTYALDVETVRSLDDLARRWNVSKIAATAIRAGATLATENAKDFRRFERAGLVLATD